MRKRPWSDISIRDCGEDLKKIPAALSCVQPHPYVSLGAPYVEGVDPYSLREGVIKRLLRAQDQVQIDHPELCFSVFDAWRPISVQSFMVDYSIKQACGLRGLNLDSCKGSPIFHEVVESVEKFWAPPSLDPSVPPPHSTGAAVDLTLADSKGAPLDMGGEIDAIGDFSEPMYYSKSAKLQPDSCFDVWHSRRCLLANAMTNAGFAQHPNEWWHFSYGDQLWAWSSNSSEAIYGAWTPPESKSKIC